MCYKYFTFYRNTFINIELINACLKNHLVISSKTTYITVIKKIKIKKLQNININIKNSGFALLRLIFKQCEHELFIF